MQEKFVDILDDGEQINVCYLPNKKKVYISSIIVSVLVLGFICAGVALGMFVPEEGYEPLAPIFCKRSNTALVEISLLKPAKLNATACSVVCKNLFSCASKPLLSSRKPS